MGKAKLMGGEMSKKENGLLEMDNNVVIVWGRRLKGVKW